MVLVSIIENLSNVKIYKYRYNKFIIDNTKIYIDILDFFKNSKCKILFSIDNNAITNYLYKDYIKQDYLKNCDTTKIRKMMKIKNLQRTKKIYY